MRFGRYAVYAGLLAALAAWAGRGGRPAVPEQPPRPLIATGTRPGAVVETSVTSLMQPRPRAEETPGSELPAATPALPPVSVKTADPVAALLEDPSLTTGQVESVRQSASAKEIRLQALQEAVYRSRLEYPEVSRRARQVQEDFEVELRGALSLAQMERFVQLKRQGRIGTYAIVIPGETNVRRQP